MKTDFLIIGSGIAGLNFALLAAQHGRVVLVTKKEIIDFARRWDPQPFHVDEEAARSSIYGGITACTAHIFAIVCRLDAEMETKLAGIAGLGFDEMRVHQPLRAGDTVHIMSECMDVRRSKSKSRQRERACHHLKSKSS